MPVILPAVKNGMQDQEKDHNGGNGGNNDDKHFDIDKDHIIRPAGHRLVITAEIIGMRILGGKNDLPGTRSAYHDNNRRFPQSHFAAGLQLHSRSLK